MTTIGWIIFSILVLIVWAFDLGVFSRKQRTLGIKGAISWTLIWVLLAITFGMGIYFFRGPHDAVLFFTGYIVEQSLSVDNLFVFLVVFRFFAVEEKYQHRVLFWGIVGALILRAILIFAGIFLIHHFEFLTYLLGTFLIFTGAKTAFGDDNRFSPESNPVISFLKKVLPVGDKYEEGRFLVKENGVLRATPLFVVLAVIEFTDVVFALDSIPAILAITTDSFIVYTSNVFAILGLRSMFFALSGVLELFYLLQYGISVVLMLVGARMLLAGWIEIPEIYLLILILVILSVSILASIFHAKFSKGSVAK